MHGSFLKNQGKKGKRGPQAPAEFVEREDPLRNEDPNQDTHR
jgi:hypothetical protein